MDIIITAAITLLLPAAAFRGLQNGFYALHILIFAALVWLLQPSIGHVEMFSAKAFTVVLAAHLPIINLVTFFAYYCDKRASRRGGWRVPERTLHALALIGGTPAAWLAQKRLRHKSRKPSFQILFWMITMMQVVALAVLMLKPF